MKNFKSTAVLFIFLFSSLQCLAMGGQDDWQKEGNGGSYSNNNNNSNSNKSGSSSNANQDDSGNKGWKIPNGEVVKEAYRNLKGSVNSVSGRILDELNSSGN